ncbi:amidase [Sorangium atrum]|uniref:Amidase n=1 Tax=Sorangium atrum TaxID=2995308 RepID=A0ABT5CIL7_9BACT|nr:amidase [Sorangium aterium]MDC0684967.1 amidase [Sorangium aterium]
MLPASLVQATAVELLALYRSRSASPVEALRAVLAHVERHGAPLNAFALLDEERALEAARASEARWARGEPVGRLDGVPVSVKDLLLTRGWPTRRGSRTVDAAGPWTEDAPAVARLREHGAVLFGKTTTSEFGLKGLGDSPLTGITRNAWDPRRTPGGSSAGAVTAVAAGFGPLAVGTDGGGSIRVPSAFSGVVGCKPTFGRVPAHPASVVGVPPHVGPIARTVGDAALLLSVLSGPDDRDPFRAPPPREDALYLGAVVAVDASDAPDASNTLDASDALNARFLRRVRVGVSATLGYVDLPGETRARFDAAVALLQRLGAEVDEVAPPFADPGGVLRTLFAARAAHTVRELGPEQRALLDPAVQSAAAQGEALSAVAYLEAERQRAELALTMAAFHRRFDLLVTPTSAGAAPLIDGGALPPSFAAPFSLTRQPAISVPMGLTSAGLPLGLQIVGRHFEEALVLRAALALERESAPLQAPPLRAS